MLNFHAKAEAKRLQSGAGQPPLGQPACDFLRLQPPFLWTLLILSRCRWRLRWFKAENCWPAGLELARLGPPFHGLADQHVYEAHSGAPAQKISASAENGSFNPCARPFGHNFCICLYIQCIGVHWRVPSGLVARQDVFGRGAGLASLSQAGRPAAYARHESETCNLHNFCIWTPN